GRLDRRPSSPHPRRADAPLGCGSRLVEATRLPRLRDPPDRGWPGVRCLRRQALWCLVAAARDGLVENNSGCRAGPVPHAFVSPSLRRSLEWGRPLGPSGASPVRVAILQTLARIIAALGLALAEPARRKPVRR